MLSSLKLLWLGRDPWKQAHLSHCTTDMKNIVFPPRMLSLNSFESTCYVSFIVRMRKTSTFRIKTIIHTHSYKPIVSSAEVHKNHISWQVLWNWLMLALNHKNLLSLLGSSNQKAVLAKQYLTGLKIRTEQQGTAKRYLKSTCLTLQLNPKSTLPMDRKKGRESCLSLQMSCMPRLQCHSILFSNIFKLSVMP